MQQHTYKNLTIEIFDDTTYRYGYDDNSFTYAEHYFAAMAYDFPSAQYGIKIWENEQLASDCLIIGYGGTTNVAPNTSLINEDELIVCCGNTVFCLELPALKLKWKMEGCEVACLQIFKQDDQYIVNGQQTVTALDKDGYIDWQYPVLMSLDDGEIFRIENDGIWLLDNQNKEHKIDFKGKPK